jgi:hypothetical protein
VALMATAREGSTMSQAQNLIEVNVADHFG